MKNYVLFIVLISCMLTTLTCKKHDYGNPVDPSVDAPAPSKLILVRLTEAAADLSWTLPSIDPEYPKFPRKIIIEQSTDGTTFSAVDTCEDTTTVRCVAGVYQYDVSYQFRVRMNVAEKSVVTNTVCGLLKFSAPYNLVIKSITETAALLQWADTCAFETGFVIERSTDNATWIVVDSTGSSITTKSVPGPYLPKLMYWFCVRAKSVNNFTAYSNTATTECTLAAPSNVAVTSFSETSAELTWTDNSAFELEFVIEQSADNLIWTVVDSAVANSTSKTVAGIYQAGVAYSFRVKAKSVYHVSATSVPVSRTLTFDAPTNMTVTLTATAATVSWSYSSSFQTGFVIEKSMDGTSFASVDSVSADTRSRVIAGTYQAGVSYYYRVKARSLFNISQPSAVAVGTVHDVTMVSIVGGTFQMGSTTGSSEEQPVHAVSVGSFYMDKYVITYEKWSDVRNWGLTHGYTDLPTGQNGCNPVGANNPVTMVNWYDVVKWCNARSEKDGLAPVYYTNNSKMTVYRTEQIDLALNAVNWTANGYRLPTEAEWEFAARGGILSGNYTYSGSNTIGNVAWYSGNSSNATHPVGQKSANELGLYDMSGNVWEWCWDWYGPYAATMQTDPTGASSGSTKVVRGGSFYLNANYCRSSNRNSYDVPSIHAVSYGFRCAQD